MSKYSYIIDFTKPDKVVIFNNKKYLIANPRLGSEKDVTRLNDLFDDLNYDVDIYLDKNSKEMRKLIRTYSQNDYSEWSCFLCFIMSHGENEAIVACDEEIITKDDFTL